MCVVVQTALAAAKVIGARADAGETAAAEHAKLAETAEKDAQQKVEDTIAKEKAEEEAAAAKAEADAAAKV